MVALESLPQTQFRHPTAEGAPFELTALPFSLGITTVLGGGAADGTEGGLWFENPGHQ